MTIVATAAGVAALALGLMRWLRVAQREHYIPGSCRITAWRWIRSRPPNGALAPVAGTGAAVAVASGLLGSSPGAVGGGLVAFAGVAAFPWGMPVAGSPRLRMTRRASVLAAVAVAVAGVAWAVLWAVAGAPAGLAVVAVGAPVVVDVAAAMAAPFERRALERHRRRAADRLARCDPFVIAVTGSWGKTSTKNHIRDLLAGSVDVVASPASWNNTAGLSRTMNEHLTESTEALVVEMGMYGPGEIRQMCSWVRPNVAVISAVGPMHLERVGSLEGIVRAKSEILERADVAVLWVDDRRLAELAETCDVPKVWRVGTRGGSDLDVEVEIDTSRDEIVVWAQGERLGGCPRAGGAHPGNVGCAVAAALAYGVSGRHVAGRLTHLSNPSHRATTGTNDAGVLVVDDTFNANPSGALAAVGNLERSVQGRRAVVTPGMVELGTLQDEENARLARAVGDSGATLVVVGWTNRRALVGAASGPVVLVGSREEAVAWVRRNLEQGDGVLWENDLPDHYP